MDHTEMTKQFLAIIVCLSLFPLISEAQDRKCSVVPAKSAAILYKPHVFTCFSKPETLILAWKWGYMNEDGSAPSTSDGLPTRYSNISTLGVSKTNESTPQNLMQSEGFLVNYVSLRKSTMTMTDVKSNAAGPFYCFVWDIIAQKVIFCQTDLIVFAKQPICATTEIDPSTGIVTNLKCSASFRGSAILLMRITDSKDVVRNETVQNFTAFGSHNYDLTYFHRVAITPERGHYHRVSPNVGIESSFRGTITLDKEDVYTYTWQIEVDAPVTYAYITPQNATRCSSRTCYMHETIVCTSDGRPKPDTFEWRVSVNYRNFMTLLYQTNEQKVLDSGRNTYECRVYNFMSNYNFTTSARFTAHILAFEWYLDEYATYLSEGRSKHNTWYPLTIVVPFAAIIWVFLPCHKRF